MHPLMKYRRRVPSFFCCDGVWMRNLFFHKNLVILLPVMVAQYRGLKKKIMVRRLPDGSRFSFQQFYSNFILCEMALTEIVYY